MKRKNTLQQNRAGQRNWCLYLLYGMHANVRNIQRQFPEASLAQLELALLKARESIKTAYDREPRR